MKAPRFPITKLLLAKGGPSPHCVRRKVERDNIPIHQQQFPTKQPLRASGNLVIEPSLEIIDPVPIHRENFPIPLPPPGINSMEWDDEEFDEGEEISDTHLDPEPAPMTSEKLIPATPPPASSAPSMTSAPPAKPTLSAAPALPTASPVIAAEPDTQPATQAVAPLAASSNSSGNAISEDTHNATDSDWDSRIQSRTAASRAIFPAPSSRRIDKKIRGLEEYMGYYLSTGNAPMEAPPHLEGAELGDVFIHSNEDASKHQVWMRTAGAEWERINAGHNHPYLLGYRLLLKNGRPAWVTKKTIATYHYRR